MQVILLHNTPLHVCSKAIRKCWASEGNSDTTSEIYQKVFEDDSEYLTGVEHHTGPKDKALIHRVGNKNKHASTLEHLVYTFDIDGTSRALLQEHARHRISSFSVQSSRYTIDKVLEGIGTIEECLVMTGDADIDNLNIAHMKNLAELMERRGKSLPRDVSKYAIVEAYKTSLVWTINARSLQNFLALRTNKAALKEIRDLAYTVYEQLPDDHKYLFSEYLYEETTNEGLHNSSEEHC